MVCSIHLIIVGMMKKMFAIMWCLNLKNLYIPHNLMWAVQCNWPVDMCEGWLNHSGLGEGSVLMWVYMCYQWSFRVWYSTECLTCSKILPDPYHCSSLNALVSDGHLTKNTSIEKLESVIMDKSLPSNQISRVFNMQFQYMWYQSSPAINFKIFM